MKYIIALIAVLILIRIDFILRTFDDLSSKFTSNSSTTLSNELPDRGPAPISVAEDRAIKTSPRTNFIIMLDRFADNPDESFRKAAFEIFKAHPTVFGKELDPQLAGSVFSWRDLIVQNAQQLPLFLLDLMKILQGENRDIVVRFYSLILDANPQWFLSTYILAKDPGCVVATQLADPHAEEEKLNILFDREKALNQLVETELKPEEKLLARSCLLQLRDHLGRITAPPGTAAPAASEGSQEGADQ